MEQVQAQGVFGALRSREHLTWSEEGRVRLGRVRLIQAEGTAEEGPEVREPERERASPLGTGKVQWD